MICSQARVPGVSVAQVARRYDLNANQVFNWLKDSRFAPEEGADDAARFLPVEVIEEAPPEACRPISPPATPATSAAGLIELDLASGHRLRISGSYDPDALAHLIRGLGP
jgi:transposase